MDMQTSAVRLEIDDREGGGADSPACREARQFASYLKEIADLNRIFLDLLRMLDGAPSEAALALRDASTDALDVMAACPFPLFVLESAHAGSNDDAHSLKHSVLVSKASPSVCSFAVSAAFLSWHLARSNACAARALLGLDPHRVERLRTMTLTQAQAPIVGGARLRARWPDNRRFWSLLRCAAADGESLRAVRLLGRQLMAAEELARISAASGRAVSRESRRHTVWPMRADRAIPQGVS